MRKDRGTEGVGALRNETGLDSCPSKEEIYRREDEAEARIVQEIGRRLDEEERASSSNKRAKVSG